MDLFDAVCLTIWWTEGTKVRIDKRWKNTFNYSVEVTNTDHVIIKMFLKYLRERLDVRNGKIKLQLQIHEGDNQENLEKFWETETGIPRSQFNKTIVRPIGNKIGKSKGTCKARVYDKKLYLKMADLLENLRGVVHR
ncbi:hypothetical protein HY385_00570 [Candidatus Daviesbacteria bacterium]|nr:hypothetical protein [Candidatus Daviesbacteria bacterium]